jgi:hypothetical protein
LPPALFATWHWGFGNELWHLGFSLDSSRVFGRRKK